MNFLSYRYILRMIGRHPISALYSAEQINMEDVIPQVKIIFLHSWGKLLDKVKYFEYDGYYGE